MILAYIWFFFAQQSTHATFFPVILTEANSFINSIDRWRMLDSHCFIHFCLINSICLICSKLMQSIAFLMALTLSIHCKCFGLLLKWIYTLTNWAAHNNGRWILQNVINYNIDNLLLKYFSITFILLTIVR